MSERIINGHSAQATAVIGGSVALSSEHASTSESGQDSPNHSLPAPQNVDELLDIKTKLTEAEKKAEDLQTELTEAEKKAEDLQTELAKAEKKAEDLQTELAKAEKKAATRRWARKASASPDPANPSDLRLTSTSTSTSTSTTELTDAKAELEIVRRAAENWIRGVSALLGLFSIGSIVFGRETLKGLADGTQEGVALGLLGSALLLACIAIFTGYHAAYGWPSTRALKTKGGTKHSAAALGPVKALLSRDTPPISEKVVVENIKEFYADTYQRTLQAVMALRISVLCSFLSLGVMAIAAGLVYFAWDVN